MGNGWFNEGETGLECFKKKKKHKVTANALEQLEIQRGLSLGATAALLSCGPHLPALGHAPWFSRTVEHRAGRPGHPVQGGDCPSSQPGLPGEPQSPSRLRASRNLSHLVPLAQTQGLGEAQSEATSLPPSRRPHSRSGWSWSSSGSLGKGERMERPSGGRALLACAADACVLLGSPPGAGVRERALGQEPGGHNPSCPRCQLGGPGQTTKPERHTPYPEKRVTVLGQMHGGPKQRMA